MDKRLGRLIAVVLIGLLAGCASVGPKDANYAPGEKEQELAISTCAKTFREISGSASEDCEVQPAEMFWDAPYYTYDAIGKEEEKSDSLGNITVIVESSKDRYYFLYDLDCERIIAYRVVEK